MSEVLSIWRGIVPQRRSIHDIAADVAERHGLTLAQLRGEAGTKDVYVPRQAAYAAIREELNVSLGKIGRFFGRNHEAISHGIKRHQQRTADR